MKIFFIIFYIFGVSTLSAQLATSIPSGHAHNDYEKARTPLIEALKTGFVSIEIDIFPYKGNLKVAHVPLFLDSAKGLEELYFKPLENWISSHGQVFKNKNQTLIFMLDIKRQSSVAYEQLRTLCQKYEHLLTIHYPDSVQKGVLQIILSGKKPYELVQNDSVRYMLIDGSLNTIGHSIYNANIAPRVSASYGSQFKWRGKGTMPAKQLEKLHTLVKKAHADGRRIRFWAMPNNEKVWRTFLDAGVDWMNVDKLSKFKKFWADYKLNEELEVPR